MTAKHWIALDQLTVSATVVVQLALVVHFRGSEVLGSFALILGLHTVAAGTIRAATGEVALHRQAAESSRPQSTSHVSGALLAASAVAPLFLLGAVVPVMGLPLASIFALGSPVLVLRDSLRFFEYQRERHRSAFAWTAVQSTLELAALFVAFTLGANLPAALATSWSVVLIPSLIRLERGHLRPTLRDAWMWFRDRSAEVKHFGLEALFASAANYLVIPLVASFVSLPAAGGFRIAQAVLGPVTVILGTLRYSAIPSISRMMADRAKLQQRLALVAVFLTAFSTSLGLVLLLLPKGLTQILAGSTVGIFYAIVLPVALQKGLMAAALPYTVLLKLEGRAAWTVLLKVGFIALSVLGVMLGSGYGAQGAALGLVAAATITLLLHMLACAVKPLTERPSGPATEDGDTR